MRRIFQAILPTVTLAGCSSIGVGYDKITSEVVGVEGDQDGDGYSGADDCDDNNPAVNGASVEICDGIDNNCDGQIDEYVTVSFWPDADEDGFGDMDAAATEGCEAPDGMVSNSDDCDDTDAAFNPAAVEDDCTDPNDYNCDGSVAYTDEDGDGFPACEDCDDTEPSTYPGADDTWYDGIDADCAGNSDYDADTDGYDSDAYGGDDCNDTDSSVHPGAADTWYDGVD
ncbi:MAG TPA: hypothetical protein DFR83_22150, partial [Deltaproteobacteria bacterium]|nr:hypothetical protein [Deltaproteobacteria bacterium]